MKKRIFEIIAGLIIAWMVIVSITITINSIQRDHSNPYDDESLLDFGQEEEQKE